jgi:predicted O-linked N-acetylglucosamine transferase (SPINDLY family)
LSLRPDFAEALIARGNVLMELGRVPEALIHYERALLLAPESAEALYQRGSALFQLKRFEAAAASFARLLELSPDHDYAAGGMFHARLHACQWGEYGATAAELAAAVERGEKCEVPFSFLAHNANPATQLECARLYTADKFPPAKDPIWTGERYRHDRIRVAYLSADFHDHATAYLMAGLFEAHDRARFEISAISFGPDPPGPMRGRLRPAFDRFLEVRETSERETARLLRELEIDIAVDLKGYTTDARPGILAQRGAPVQVSYLGYPGTLGADYIDYILADAYVIPAGHERFYSEKIVRLPGSYQVNDRKRAIAGQTPSRAELGLPRDGFVFCCFNNSYKIAPGVFDVWMRLLGQVPGSVLWLLEDNADATRNLVQEADRRGVAADRLVFAPRFGLPEHLARHRQAGLFLDTFPYNAHTTASDALWAGLPLVTCSGETFASRVAGSLLHAAGVPELATDNFVDYEALALKLAMEPDTLAAVRAKLARRRDACPLFDTGLFCRHLEAAYAAMHERHRRDEPPASFDVPPFDS